MLIKNYMTRHPITVGPDLAVVEAQRIMADNRVKHLPVVDSGKHILGILTPSRFSITADRMTSLDVWEITRRLTHVTVGDLMVKGETLVTISADATLEDAAYLMVSRHITGLPVVDADRVVVGIITQSDLLAELYNLLGARESGWRITVRVPDQRGEYAKLVQTIYNHGWSLMAMGGVRSPNAPDHWDVVLKVGRCSEQQPLIAALEQIEGQTIVDLRCVEVAEAKGEGGHAA
jgi:acetoin utilization protein AcuB